MEHFKTLSQFAAYLELPRPEHPMFCMYTALHEGSLPCTRASSPPISNDCYSISFKKLLQGELNYGRTKYDFTNGSLFFIGPRQTLQWENGSTDDQQGFSIHFHEDFIKGTDLANQIRKYGYFSYSVNEALHLSPREEKQLERIVENMELEYLNNPDSFSKDIIVAHLSTLLKYAQRFYERQFSQRTALSIGLLERFTDSLATYFSSGQLEENGVPSIEKLATNLGVSQRYLSDTLKRETGKTTTEHLQLFLVDEAKNLLLNPNTSVAEVAYQLGFEYPPYFSRLFKKKSGISPSEFRIKYAKN